MQLSRRKFVLGASALVAAPAIVRATSIMPVKAPALDLSALILNEERFVCGWTDPRGVYGSILGLAQLKIEGETARFDTGAAPWNGA